MIHSTPSRLRISAIASPVFMRLLRAFRPRAFSPGTPVTSCVDQAATKPSVCRAVAARRDLSVELRDAFKEPAKSLSSKRMGRSHGVARNGGKGRGNAHPFHCGVVGGCAAPGTRCDTTAAEKR